LRKAQEAKSRNHICVITTEYGEPFNVDGFSRFTRDAICAAGLPLDGQPHGLRKTRTRLLADAEATAHEIRLRSEKNPLQRRNAIGEKLIAGAAAIAPL